MEKYYIEMLSASLVREYLSRKKLVNTLRQLDEEQIEFATCVRNRRILVDALNIAKLIKRSKRQVFALDSMVEIIVQYFLGHAQDNRGKTEVLQSDHQFEHTEDHIAKLQRNESFSLKDLHQEEVCNIEGNVEEALDGKVACDEVEGIPLIWESTEQRKASITKDLVLLNNDQRGNTAVVDATRSVFRNVTSNIASCDNDQRSQNDSRHQCHDIIVCDTKKQYAKEQLSHLELQSKNSANEIQSVYMLKKDLVSNKSNEEGSKTQRRCSLLDVSGDSGILTRGGCSVIQDHSKSVHTESEADSASESCDSVIDLLKDRCGNTTLTTDIFRKESAIVRKNDSAVDICPNEVKVIFEQMEGCNNAEVERGADQTLDSKELEKFKEETEEVEKWACERSEKHDRHNEVTMEDWGEEDKEELDVLQPLSEDTRIMSAESRRNTILKRYYWIPYK